MKVLTSEAYVQHSLKREISNDYEAFLSPTFIKCPNCQCGIVLAKTNDERKTFCIVLSGLALLIPEDAKSDDLEDWFNNIIKPAFFQFIEDQKKKETPKAS